MLASLLVLLATTFAESKTLALQICLDRAGYSCNTIDGQWGRKSERALFAYLEAIGRGSEFSADLTPDVACERYFANRGDLFRRETVTANDLAAVMSIPTDPAARAELAQMGYESIKEMFAERGHLSQRALERLNPQVNWDSIAIGQIIIIPDFPTIDELLATWPKPPNAPRTGEAGSVRVSISNFEISAYDTNGKCLSRLPCSIAKDKAKLPPRGELKITTPIANPNYTYTPDFTPKGEKPKRYVWPSGPNCPIGVAWLGLNLPGYGIHGTVRPESIGHAESHGCFRLADWNAAKLYSLCRPGTRVIIEE